MKVQLVIINILVFTFGCGTELALQGTENEPIQMNPVFLNPFQTVAVTGSIVNLRQGPGTQYQIVGTALAGDSLLVTGETTDWYRIYSPEKSLFAWVFAGLTSGAALPQ